MSLSTEENSEFARITAILKEIGKDNLLQDFKEHELTVRVRWLYLKNIANMHCNQ
jgi:hypothetical protein